jgi:hypothetical protein
MFTNDNNIRKKHSGDVIVGKDTKEEVNFRNRNNPKRDFCSKLGNKRVVLHGPQGVNEKKEVDPRINEAGLTNDIFF